MNEQQAALIIEFAKEFIVAIRKIEPTFKKAFFRYCADGTTYGSNGSYSVDSKAMLIDPFMQSSFFSSMNNKATELLSVMQKDKGVVLLIIDAEFNYDVKFDYENLERWKITKANGGTGMPDL